MLSFLNYPCPAFGAQREPVASSWLTKIWYIITGRYKIRKTKKRRVIMMPFTRYRVVLVPLPAFIRASTAGW